MGSLASKINEKDKKTEGRNAFQVFANGGLGMLVVLVSYHFFRSSGVALYILVFATANADTLSSEIGKFFKQPTFDIIRWKTVPVGWSGGVSWAGTLAGWTGSCAIALLGALIVGGSPKQYWCIAIFGFIGMLIDSIYGSLLQAKYRDNQGNISETGAEADLIRGYHWCTNDGVNLLSILTTLALYGALMPE